MREILARVMVLVLVVSLVLAACAEAGPDAVVEEGAAEDEGATEEAGADEPGDDEGSEPVETVVPEEDEIDLSGEVVKIYHIGDLTGPEAAFWTAGIRSVEDIVAAMNERDGVFGAEMELIFYDTAGEEGAAEGAFEEMVSGDEAVLGVIVHDPVDALALAPLADEAKVPVISLGYADGGNVEEGYVFWLGVPADIQFSHFLEFVVDNWEDVRPVGAGEEIRVAYLGWNDGSGAAGLTDGVLDYVDSVGIEVVYQAEFNRSWAEDLTNEVLLARRNEANVIYTNTFAHGPAVLLNDLHRIGLYEEFLVGGPVAALDTQTYGYLERPEFFNGFYGLSAFGWWSDEDHTGVALALGHIEANGRSLAEQSAGYLLGHGAVDILRMGVAGAVQAEGVEGLDGEAVYEAIAGMEGYEVLGGLMEVDFSEGRILNRLEVRRVVDFLVFEVVGE